MTRSTTVHPASDDDAIEHLAQQLAGCPAAELDERRARLVLASLGIADGVARRYRGRGVDDDDLVQVARLALVGASVRYVPERGNGFVPYAVPSIVGELKRYFRDHTWTVRPPRHLQELSLESATAQEDLRHRLGREPSVVEVAQALEVDVATVRAVRTSASAYRSVSLDAPHPSGGTRSDHVPGPGDIADAVDTHFALAHALEGLTERERAVVHLRFVEDRTQREIGQVIGVSQMQVSRILTTILDRLRIRMADGAAA